MATEPQLFDAPGEIEESPPDPERIRLARELRGYTQQEVVDRMQSRVSTAAVSQFENGRNRPSEAVLEDLANALEVPVGFFRAQWPSGVTRESATYFRHLRSTSARDRRRAGALAVLLQDLLAAIDLHYQLPSIDVPDLSLDLDAPSEAIAEAADDVRHAWSLSDAPIPHVVRELERHGIAVARLDLDSSEIDAFSSKAGKRPVVILGADRGETYVRSRFDAAHELGHLVLHGDEGIGTKALEAQAHDFASAFLLPDAVAKAELPRQLDASGWSRLAELKRVRGMSIASLLYRARHVGVISPNVYTNAMKYLSSKGWRRQEPGDKELGAPESPLLLQRTLRRLAVEYDLSTEELAEQAQLPVKDVIRLVEALTDARPVIEL